MHALYHLLQKPLGACQRVVCQKEIQGHVVVRADVVVIVMWCVGSVEAHGGYQLVEHIQSDMCVVEKVFLVLLLQACIQVLVYSLSYIGCSACMLCTAGVSCATRYPCC